MKELFKITGLLLVFYMISVATSVKKFGELPCYYKIESFLKKDSLHFAGLMTSTNDTLVIRTYQDTLWEMKTAEICRILKDSCNMTSFSILVTDTTSRMDPINGTRFGNKIYFRKCN